VFNGYCGAESGSVPVAAVAPAILISEMEVQKKETSTDKPPILPPPAHDEKGARL
jgi:TldD protein